MLHIYIRNLILCPKYCLRVLRSDLKRSSGGEKHITSKRSSFDPKAQSDGQLLRAQKGSSALDLYSKRISLCVGSRSLSFSLFSAIFAQRDTNQILMLSPQEATAAAKSSIKLLYLNMR